jgi:hypothetical protein
MPSTARPPNRIDWQSLRDRIDLAAVATGLLGPAPGRRGERGRKLWWSCPFHEDRNPSFAVDPGKPWWRCYGCSESGDAASLVMRLERVAFPEAIAILTGGPAPERTARTPRPRPAARPPAEVPPRPSGMPEADALALVEAAAAGLRSPEGADALTCLHGRGLAAETIRRGRIGWTPRVAIPRADGTTFNALGVVIPWFTGDRLALVKIRQPDGRRPKYAEAYRDPARLVCYPGPETIRPGRPLIVTEGELDALLLGQELAGLAAVVTLGSASARPTPAILGTMLPASPWFLATDRDEAGDLAAASWPGRARRVRPPEPFKDWSEARQGGVDLARWWRDVLAGIDRPPLFSWDELARWRWGQAVGDPEPGIIFPERTIAMDANNGYNEFHEPNSLVR